MEAHQLSLQMSKARQSRIAILHTQLHPTCIVHTQIGAELHSPGKWTFTRLTLA